MGPMSHAANDLPTSPPTTDLAAAWECNPARDSKELPERRGLGRMRPTVATIIVNYHSVPEIFRCVETVEQFLHPDYGIVVSNSPDEVTTIWRFVEERPRWQVVYSGGNVGYGTAVNLAAASVEASYLAILNPDIELSDSTVRDGIDYLGQHQDTGIVGVRLLDADGRVSKSFSLSSRYADVLRELGPTLTSSIVSRCSRLLPRHVKVILRHLWAVPRRGSAPAGCSHVREVCAVSGACMVVRASEFAAIGGFDEDFHLFWEDIDLCWRYRMSGLGVTFLDVGRTVHRGSTSMARASRTARVAKYHSFRVFTRKYATTWVSKILALPYVVWARLAEYVAREIA